MTMFEGRERQRLQQQIRIELRHARAAHSD
jgi:hypothetical protein